MFEGAWLIAFVTLQRAAELVYAERNTRRLRARGGVEFGQSHYPLMVAFHAAWLAGLWWFGATRPVVPGFLAVFVLLQGLRAWVIASLGERWTTRIVVLPGAPLVRRGPYRRLRHPNYIIVALEIAVVPLAVGLPVFAALFSIAQIPLLIYRMAVESAALAWATQTDAPAGAAPEWPGRLAGQ
ncbi:MAG TPA: isoprenylcysteine carboxylmethyltransferase family protein [Xanthobacteraceae bacterium]|nr:isoprenylcysteine carboxylmethyltransferase family protein [Xanthobacteraceae bacterium]